MRRLVLAAVAAGQTSEQIAECLDREGFRPVSNRDDRFTPSPARELVYRLGLSPPCRPAESLGPDEWWVRDLADKLGVSYHRFKDWVKKGYVHFRKVARRGNLVIWADAEERERLGRLRDYPRPGRSNRYADELTRPKDRSAPKRGRKAKPSSDGHDDGLIGRNPLSLSVRRLKKQPSPMWRRAVFLEDRPSERGRDTLACLVKGSATDHSARYCRVCSSPGR